MNLKNGNDIYMKFLLDFSINSQANQFYTSYHFISILCLFVYIDNYQKMLKSITVIFIYLRLKKNGSRKFVV